MASKPPPRRVAHHHAVKFYGDEVSLYTTVAGFLSEGLIAGQPALVIATSAHQGPIVDQLRARLIDVDAAIRQGTLILRDANELLDAFMVHDVPDPQAFTDSVGLIVEDVLRTQPATTVLRAYGEMVDVLWARGLRDAAVALEMLWNKLALAHGFALLCGYSMGHFYKQAQGFQDVCAQHTEVHHVGADIPILKMRRARPA